MSEYNQRDPDLINALAQAYAANPPDARNHLAGDPWALPPKPQAELRDPIKQQARALQSKAMEADPIEMAMGLLGPRVPLPRVPNPIRAYHGSPHDFDRFDLSKIGTGEGAQAYGHGLYFAEREGVARSYRDNLAYGPNDLWGGAEFAPHINGKLVTRPYEVPATQYLKFNRGDYAGAINDAERSALLDHKYPTLAESAKQTAETLRNWRDAGVKVEFKPTNGRMYEVALHAKPEQFLDWDKPLSGQSEAVRRGLQPVISKLEADLPWPRAEPPGIEDIVRGRHGQEAVGALNEAGIPGIRYLDQGSRGKGEGTSNYVVWTPEIIEILRKYGLVGPAVVGGGAALNGLSESPQQ